MCIPVSFSSTVKIIANNYYIDVGAFISNLFKSNTNRETDGWPDGRQTHRQRSHNLQECSNHDSLRRTVWPTETSLQTKLNWCREDLEQTAQFILLTGLMV